MKQINK